MKNLSFKYFLLIGVIHFIPGQAFASDVYTAYSGSQQGVTIRDANTLAQSFSFNTGFNINGIVAGTSNNFYVTSGNTIYDYGTNGALQTSFSWGDNSITYGAITRSGNDIYSTYSGSQQGVTIRDANTLAQSFSFNTGYNINGITAGNNNNLYVTSGNSIYDYGTNGTLQSSFSWGDNSITYGAITTNGSSIFSVYSGSQQGVTIRDANTLAQTGLITPGFAINGISIGFNNDVYLTSGNTIYDYGINGVLINSFSWGDNSIAYGAITIAPAAVPVPGAIWLMISGLIGVLGLNRRKSAAV